MNVITKSNGNKVVEFGSGRKACFVEVDADNNYVYAWSEMRCAGYNKAKVKIAKNHSKTWERIDAIVAELKEQA